jgi:hypothetical protein
MERNGRNQQKTEQPYVENTALSIEDQRQCGQGSKTAEKNFKRPHHFLCRCNIGYDYVFLAAILDVSLIFDEALPFALSQAALILKLANTNWDLLKMRMHSIKEKR